MVSIGCCLFIEGGRQPRSNFWARKQASACGIGRAALQSYRESHAEADRHPQLLEHLCNTNAAF